MGLEGSLGPPQLIVPSDAGNRRGNWVSRCGSVHPHLYLIAFLVGVDL